MSEQSNVPDPVNNWRKIIAPVSMHQGAHLEFGRALGPVGRGPVVAAAGVEEDLPAGHGRVLVDGVGQAEARVLPRHLLLAEVDERLVQPLLQPRRHPPRLLLARAEHGVAAQLLLHLPALVPEGGNGILDYIVDLDHLMEEGKSKCNGGPV